MPELAEVERFRQLLMPLVCKKAAAGPKKTCCLSLETPSPTPPKAFPADEELEELQTYTVCNVLRKGKLIRIDLESPGREGRYLFLHMGMTGRISTKEHVPQLESLKGGDSYPPPHTHLILRSNGHEAAFSDPRRFGKVVVCPTSEDEFDDLAPDALDSPGTLDGLVGKRKGIKALLLDQKAVISGVGNWIADEILYQSQIHSDQSMLTSEERDVIRDKLRMVLTTAIEYMGKEEGFPSEWMFHRRWSKGKGETTKDSKGRKISWIESGGRSSAIVPAVQKLKSRKNKKEANKTTNTKERKRTEAGRQETAKPKDGAKSKAKKGASRKKAKTADERPARAVHVGTRRSARISK